MGELNDPILTRRRPQVRKPVAVIALGIKFVTLALTSDRIYDKVSETTRSQLY